MNKDDRKERILIAATNIIAEKGYEQAKISHIAEEAEVASGLIYSQGFFINKLDLLLSIVLRFWILLNEKVTSAIDETQSPQEKIRIFLAILDDLLIARQFAHWIQAPLQTHE